MAPGHLVFYDGNCGLCDASVQWILRRDKKGIFYFAPLQGETAKEKLQELREKEPDLDSLVLIENMDGTPLVRSLAVLRIAYHLGGVWTLPGLLSFLPAWLFDWLYRFVARNRKKIFKKEPFCDIPSHESRKRFLK